MIWTFSLLGWFSFFFQGWISGGKLLKLVIVEMMHRISQYLMYLVYLI